VKSAPTTRVKKSYSISREAEQFVRRVRKSRKIASDSEALDQILREALQAQSRAGIDAAYKAYYDAASDAELAEEFTWAEFAGSQLAELTK
jgi:hypothetical protein